MYLRGWWCRHRGREATRCHYSHAWISWLDRCFLLWQFLKVWIAILVNVKVQFQPLLHTFCIVLVWNPLYRIELYMAFSVALCFGYTSFRSEKLNRAGISKGTECVEYPNSSLLGYNRKQSVQFVLLWNCRSTWALLIASASLKPLFDPYVCNVTVPKSITGSRELHLFSNLVEVDFFCW